LHKEHIFKLAQYTETLTPHQAAEGIRVARHNAKSLLEDANLLYKHDRWPRSAALSILSIEEEGKVPLIRGLLLSKSLEDLRKAWKAYRSHTKKNVLAAFTNYIRDNPKLEDFRPIYDPKSDFPKMLDAVKQIGFYSDCLGNVNWSIPDKVVDQELAHYLLTTARMLLPSGGCAMESAAELQIWVKHLKGLWPNAPMEDMKKALIDCYEEARILGVLKGSATVTEMIDFLF